MSKFYQDDNRNFEGAVFLPAASQTLTITSASQQTTAFAAGTTIVRLTANSGHYHVAFGANPTASITSSLMIAPNTQVFVKVNGGDKMAFIKDAAVTTAYGSVTELA